jgi:hypothetical protein
MTFSINPTANKTQAMFQQMAIAQNGTGTTAVIAGGSATGSSSTMSVANSAATQSVNSGSTSSSGSLTTGTGSFDSTGECQCSCFCGTASFPNAAVQGVGAFGGLPGKPVPPSSSESEFNFNSKILGAMPLSALMST